VLSALAVVLLFEAYALVVNLTEGTGTLPPAFGNFERVRAPLENDKSRGEFSFAVLGDPQATETFEQIVEELKNEPLSFMVLLGDCVPHATPGDHRFFITEWSEELNVPFPVFYVVGNHDVDADRFPVSEFERTYGPSNFSFGYRGCLFIVLRVLDKPVGPRTTQESLEFLRSVLSTRRRDFGKVFVFMHIPPQTVSTDFSAREFEGANELVGLCDEYRVDYVITGDYHGYARVKVRDTTYLVTGGGGARLKAKKFGRFHHAIVLKVGHDSVSERILFMEHAGSGLEDRVERFALAEVHPWLASHWFLGIVLNAGLLGACFWLLRAFLRVRRRLRATTPPAQT
jgi:hypothetical protein